MKNRILHALNFMPKHRSESQRSQSLGLDELIDENRKFTELDGGTLDLIFMGYRLRAKALQEINLFLEGRKLKPQSMEDLLVLCFASLLTRDKIPQAVQLNVFVDAAAQRFGAHTKGLVNAFGRSILRKQDALLDSRQNHVVSWLPEAIQQRWKSHPELLEAMAHKVLERPPHGLSAFSFDDQNTLKFERLSLEEWKEKESQGRAFQAMDVGSWNLTNWIVKKIQNKEIAQAPILLDTCAAPGGKALALSRLLPKNFQVFATESKFPRLQKLKDNIQRWEKLHPLNNPIETQLFTWGEDDATSLKNISQTQVDLVLADLPCSGSGTLHTRPDLLADNLASRVQSLLKTQEKILKSLIQLKPKHLFVSLCSLDPEEIQHVSLILEKEPVFHSWQIPDTRLSEGLVAWHVEA